MSAIVSSEILFLPCDQEFYPTLIDAGLWHQKKWFDSGGCALIADSSGILRSADKKELEEYVYGGELDEVESNDATWSDDSPDFE